MERKIYHLLASSLFFLFPLVGYTQLNVDSIKNVLATTDNDSIHIEALVDLARHYARIDTQAAYDYLEQLLVKANETGSEFAYLNAYNRLGNMAQDKGDYPLSIQHYLQGILTTTDSINIARLYGGIGASHYYMNQFDSAEYYMYLGYGLKSRHDPEDTASLATSLVNMSLMAERRNDFEKVLSYLHTAKDLFESIDNQRSLAVVYINMSGAYNKLDDQVNRAKYLELAYNTSKALPDYRAIGNSAINYGHYYWDREEYFQSLNYYREAVDATRRIGQRYDLANALQNLGENYLQLGSLDEARRSIQESLALADTLGATEFSINNLLTLAKIESQGNRQAQALRYIDQAVIKADSMDYWQVKENTYKQAIELYQKMGQYQKSAELFDPYQEAKDSLAAGRQSEIVKDLQFKYQTVEKDALLAQSELEIQVKTNQRNMYLALLIGFLALSWFTFSFLINRRRLNENRIALQNERIQGLEKQQKLLALDYMVQGQEQERKRIAQDLHDGLGSLLSSAKLQMHAIQKEIEKLHELQLFDKAEELIDHAYREVRRIAHDMMPSTLNDLGLISALEDLFNQQTHPDLIIDFSYPKEELRLTEIQLIYIYRIIQEIHTNMIKYAKADHVKVELKEDNNLLQIKYEDNGIGFQTDLASRNQGIGIKSIESRIQYLNGTCQLDSQPGKGSRYNIRIPILSD